MADKRKGIAFQNFVAMVEKAFATKDNVSVESGKFITDIDSESRREFDVWIVSKFGGYHEVVTAIEVKDEKTPIGVPEVEAFLSKCGRNNINRKVMVSSKGANSAAVKLAARTGVTLMTMSEAEAFDWIRPEGFTEHRRAFSDITFHVELPEGLPLPEGDWDLLDETGTPVTTEALKVALHEADFSGVGEGEHAVGVELANEFTVRTADGEVFPVAKVVGRATLTVEVKPLVMTLHSYVGSGAGEGVNLSFASGDLQIGPMKGKLVMARRDDGSTEVSWQANPSKTKAPGSVRLVAPKVEGES